MNTGNEPVDEKRRALLFVMAAAALLGKLGCARAISPTPDVLKDVSVPRNKHALVIGNRDYPNHTDLPSANKNVTDMVEALTYLGFDVTSYNDLHPDEMRNALTKFSQEMKLKAQEKEPDNTVVVFYFCGHGFQNKGENYLLPAGVDPTSDGAAGKSIKLMEEVVNKLSPYELHPEGAGITLALIDACRTDLMGKKGVDDFNQIIVPPGTIVFFATRAGRPALAPIDEKRNTFFTGSLIEALQAADGVTPIDDVCQIVANNCLNHVSQEFKKAGLNFPPQFPEKFSGKLRNKYVIRNRDIELRIRTLENERKRIKEEATKNTQAAKENERLEAMKEAWENIKLAILPKPLIRLCEDFIRKFPDSEHIPTIQVSLEGAKKAVAGYRTAGIASDSLEDPAAKGNTDYHLELVNALKGDKDSAYRIALMYRNGSNSLVQDGHKSELWLAFAAELGNGIASWELSEIFSRTGQGPDQAKYEQLAKDLGYTPPPRLSNRGY